jgi:long-chain acyl-CoA synthetase
LAIITAEEWLERPGSVGRPLSIMEVAVVGPDGERLGPGETGEIWFRNLLGSDFEYHNAPDKTARPPRGRLRDPRRRRAPRCRRLPVPVRPQDRHGRVGRGQHLPGRGGGGARRAPGHRRRRRLRHPPRRDGRGRARRARAAAGPRGPRACAAELDAWCRERLAGYKRPRSYEVHDELPAPRPGSSPSAPCATRGGQAATGRSDARVGGLTLPPVRPVTRG